MHNDFRVGPWLVRPGLNTISQNGTSNRVEPKMMEVLVCLAEHTGEVVTKERLLQVAWPDTFVSDDVLKRSVSELRRVFGDDAHASGIIETIPKKGYRLVAAVQLMDDAERSSVPMARRSSRRRRLLVFAIIAFISLALAVPLILWNVGRIRDVMNGHKTIPEIHSIAVLPLQNLSGDPSQDYFADGMTEELITELSRVGSLRVTSRTSVMHYKKVDEALPQIARELGVDAVVEGSVLRSDHHVRITAQLIYAPNDTHLWAQSYERKMQDVLTLQGEVAANIVAQVEAKLGSTLPVAQRPPVDPRAYEAYLKGVYYWARYTGDDLQRSLKYFQEAIALDPTFAGGYAGLGDVYVSLVGYDLLPESQLDKVEFFQKKAMQLDPTLAETHESMAWVNLYRWNLAGAEMEAQRALELNPSSPDARIVALYVSRIQGKLLRPSISKFREMRQFDPISPTFIASLGFMMQSGMVDDSFEFCRDAIDLDHDSVLGHWCLGRAFLGKRQPDRAIPELQRAVDIGKVSYFRRDLARAQVAAGDRRPALRLIKEFESQNDDTFYFEIAALYAALGDKQRALDWLGKVYEKRGRKLIFASIEPAFEPLQSDPRFQDLVRRVTQVH